MKNAKNLYAILLRLYPFQYRKEFEAQMIQTFVDRYADMKASSNIVRLLFWLSFAVDELKNILEQRSSFLHDERHFLRLNNTKRVLTALVFLPMFVLFTAIFVKISLALPHPATSGIGVMLAFITLMLVAALASLTTSYVIVCVLSNGFTKLKTL
jgi:hypothetical protein